MSLTHTGYLGIYLICSGSAVEEAPSYVPICTKDANHTFPYNSNTNFCGLCGSPVEYPMEQYELSYADLFDLDIDCITKSEKDILFKSFYTFSNEANKDILIPTIEGIFGMEFDNDLESEKEIDLTSGITNIVHVAGLLSDAIDILKKNMFKHVEIKFGYLSSIQ